MQIPARLKWQRQGRGFIAYPMGNLLDHQERVATLTFTGTINSGVELGIPVWRWSVNWPGWFAEHGIRHSKQEAADLANAAWWKGVASPVPRDVKSEIAVIAARVLIMPPPNSLLTEESDFLQGLMDTLRLQYEAEMRAETTPRQVRELMANLSAELYRRRLRGDVITGTRDKWSTT